jgi:hypothetical protein
VIRVQVLESALKALLPFIDLKGAPHCLSGLETRVGHVSKQTLGKLIGTLQERVQADSPEFAAMLEQIVIDRNALVHQFAATFGTLPNTEEGHDELLKLLDAQLEQVKALEDTVHGLLVDVLRTLRASREEASPASKEFAAICAEFEAALETRTALGDEISGG